MSTGFPVLVDPREELVEVEPAARRVLGDNGVDLRGLEAEGLDILADCYVFHSGEGVIERMGAPWRLGQGCRLGRFKGS